ncbi:SCO family protein (plasmid) [Iamia sp. SCSIO 61187]|uniref:SCO family protein n=1 Tax=Iamia sp. SCSIO 61187 TaxID=2722752 RepID=UPI001C62C4E5|nr:SCO family protein [Iamia sp. SCSIO 61187]QYG95769.1 SCO family protein [Iamia sp. SCSIO 61187]
MPDAVTDDVDTGADDERTSAPAKPKAKVPRAPFIVVAVTVLLLGIAVAFRAQNPMEEPDRSALNGTMLGAPQPRPEFTLTDTDGRPYDFADETAGELTLLFFGYTSCPDVCPLHLSNLAFALERPGVPTPTVVFVGVDRQRDTPEAIRTFLDRFDPQFVGLTGTEEELRLAQEAANVSVAITEEPEEPGGDYLVGHSAQVIAYTADDQSHVVYPFGVRQQDWIDDLPVLARNEWDET